MATFHIWCWTTDNWPWLCTVIEGKREREAHTHTHTHTHTLTSWCYLSLPMSWRSLCPQAWKRHHPLYHSIDSKPLHQAQEPKPHLAQKSLLVSSNNVSYITWYIVNPKCEDNQKHAILKNLSETSEKQWSSFRIKKTLST
jgi:hypothetical protein